MTDTRYMKKNIVFAVMLALLTALTVVYIFRNSLTVGEVSNAKSGAVAEAVRPVVDPGASIPENTFNALVRKAAHIVEFGALGCELMGLTLITARIRKRRAAAYICTPMFVTLLVAVADEYIQLFTGRTSAVGDVLTDFAGSMAGIIITGAAYAVHRAARRKRL